MINTKLAKVIMMKWKLIGLVALALALPVTAAVSISRLGMWPKAVGKTVTLSILPTGINLNTATAFSVQANPGTSGVVFVQVAINFDPSKVRMAAEATTNPAFQAVILKSSMVEANASGKFSVALGLCDPLKNSCSPRPVGLGGQFEIAGLKFVPVAGAKGTTVVGFDQANVQVVDLSGSMMTAAYAGASLTVNGTGVSPTIVPTTTAGGALYSWGPFDHDPSTPWTEIPVEVQAWWTLAGASNKKTNNESVLCWWPVGQAISGTLKTNCRISFHDNPSTLDNLVFHLAPGIVIKKYPLNFKCPGGGATADCATNVPVELDTSGWASGWRHLRIRAKQTTVGGKTWTTSSELPFQIKGGTSGGEIPWCVGNGAMACMVGKSWYEGLEYENVAILGVPLKPVSGVLSLKIRASNGETQILKADLDRSLAIAATGPWPAEPNLANDRTDLGFPIIIKNPVERQQYPVSVDTTKLTNGWHSFAASNVGRESKSSFETGVIKFWFFVQN